MNYIKEDQIMIVRSTDNARAYDYSSYAFRFNGDIVAAINDFKLLELPEYKGDFEIVKGGNLHPRRYDKNKYVFFSDQPEELKEHYRNRHGRFN